MVWRGAAGWLVVMKVVLLTNPTVLKYKMSNIKYQQKIKNEKIKK